MLDHQLTGNTSFLKGAAARSLAISSGNERKGEEGDSDRRNEFHSRRGVDDFEVSSWGYSAVDAVLVFIPLGSGGSVSIYLLV